MKAKKSLGQNFLKSEPALRKIIEAGEIKLNDIILEIGPGRGALTEKLLGSSGQVLAVEKDKELVELLKEKFKKEIEEKKLILIEDDILEFEISQTVLKFFSGPRISGSLPQPDHSKNLKPFGFKIIANIPYNITGAILKKFLSAEHQPELMVLMIQQEVAQRIIARDGKESILSISVKAYGEPRIIIKVPARYFSPAPKVDSAIILIKNISKKNFIYPLLSEEGAGGGDSLIKTSPQPSPEKERGGEFEQRFWEIVKAGFAHKRKKLSSNLKNISLCQGSTLTSELGNKRAEDLTLEDWLELAKKF